MRDRQCKLVGGEEGSDGIIEALQKHDRCSSTGIPCCVLFEEGLVDLPVTESTVVPQGNTIDHTDLEEGEGRPRLEIQFCLSTRRLGVDPRCQNAAFPSPEVASQLESPFEEFWDL